MTRSKKMKKAQLAEKSSQQQTPRQRKRQRQKSKGQGKTRSRSRLCRFCPFWVNLILVFAILGVWALYQEKEETFEDAQSIREITGSGTTDLDLLSAWDKAREAAKSGDLEGALKLYETCLKTAEQLKVGQEVVLGILQHLWSVQRDLGQFSPALLSCQRILNIQTLLRGENDRRTISAMYLLAQSLTLVRPRRYMEAIHLFEKVKSKLESNLELDRGVDLDLEERKINLDKIWAYTIYHLAQRYDHEGIKGEEVKRMFGGLWTRFRRTKGESECFDGQDVIASTSADQLARILARDAAIEGPKEKAKMLEDALELSQEAYHYMKELYGEGHQLVQMALQFVIEIQARKDGRKLKAKKREEVLMKIQTKKGY